MNQPPRGENRQISEATLEQLALIQTANSGAGWFYWIGALSLINSIMEYTGASLSFPVGLGSTQLVDAIALHIKSTEASIAATAIDAVIAGIFCAFGHFSKKITWLFIVGMVLYLADMVILAMVTTMIGKLDIVGVGFHLFALYGIFRGFNASRQLAQLAKQGETQNFDPKS